ncbi:hypothetical protein WN51_07422 [Melipona quadrifasciata]|uniref:Uncharacterized protein n=1 Tax=Melipona quadrifasciata TaxID=166423 RepID=A0A0N0U2Z1_9HYME|nr:hypothetical protein WN51_07422 [Melipona quadrifasciata]
MEDIAEGDKEKENKRLWITVSSPRKLRGSKQTKSDDTQLQLSRKREAIQRPTISSPSTPAPIQLQLQLDTSTTSNNNPSNNNQIKSPPIILHESSLKQTKDRQEGPHLVHKMSKNWPYTSFKLQAGIPLYQLQHSP